MRTVELWFAATMKSKSTFSLCPVALGDRTCPLVASCQTESVWQQRKSPNSLQKCQSGDAGWQRDSNVRGEGQKINQRTIDGSFQFQCNSKILVKPLPFFKKRILQSEGEPTGTTLEAWLSVPQRLLNRGASSLRVYPPAPGLAAHRRWQSTFDYCVGRFQASRIWLPLPQRFGCNYCCLYFFPDGGLTCRPVGVFDRSLSWGLIYV